METQRDELQVKAERAAMEEANRKKKVQIAKVKVQLNELKNDQDEAIANKDFVRAQQLNLEMEQLKVCRGYSHLTG